MKYGLLCVCLCGCGHKPQQPSASTRWARAEEWQFVPGRDGRADAVFDPHTSMYCTYTLGIQQRQYCAVLAPDSLVQNAISLDTVYEELSRIKLRHMAESAAVRK